MGKLKITVAGTGYVGLSNAVLLAQHNEVIALDIIEEKIDLFIDDSESNCLKVNKAGIKTIRVCNEIENNNSNLICFNNWNDIYSYIQTIK